MKLLPVTFSVLMLCRTLPAQELEFRTLRSSTPPPSGRVDAPIAYDPATSQVFLFGGLDTDNRNDLWVYSVPAAQWRQIDAPGAPEPRHGHSLTLDPVRRRLLVFAGQARGFFSDVWAFDLAQGRWSRVPATGGGPSARYAHSAVYDARQDRLVISHGFTSAGRFDDTWALDLATNVWRNLSPSGTRPLKRCLHHAVLDEAADRMYLYGGCASGFGPCPLGDLWSFDLTQNRWTEITADPRPAPRERYGLTFDTLRNRLVLYGGSGSGKLNDVWEFDPRAAAWRKASPAGSLPDGRSQHEATYASNLGLSLFFGGAAPAPTNELLALAPGGSSPPAIAARGVRNAFSGENTSLAPGQLLSIFGTALGPVTPAVATFENGMLPRELAGVTVTVNGIPAPLLYVQSTQINAQMPYEAAGQAEARVRVTVNGAAGAEEVVALAAAAPGLFAGAWNQDGSRNSGANPAGRGSIVVLYATGQGVTIPASGTGRAATAPFAEPAAEVEVAVAGRVAQVLFRGQAPGTAGVMQLNIRLPDVVPEGEIPVVLRVGGRESAPVRIAVQ